jgi:hypothetical protein
LLSALAKLRRKKPVAFANSIRLQIGNPRRGTEFVHPRVLSFARIPAALGVLVGLRLRERNANAQKQ